MKKIVYEFDPFEMAGVEPPKKASDRKAALNEIAEFVKASALDYIADGASPVSGGQWQRSLSPDYKKKKEAEGGAGFANMELSGDMLDALICKPKGSKLVYGIEDPSQAPKADGHNNHSGKSELPAREFIPKEDQNFKRDIVSGIKAIAREFADDAD